MRQVLDRYMQDKGLTQEEFASELGVQRSHLAKLLSGDRRPSLRLLRKMRDVTKIPVEKLFDACG
jgi:transcriptional regulator with XRE-family HTH domain